MPIELYRIDDRLIHGQVVVGWGQPLDLGFIVLVDDEVAASEWEQELYRMGVPPQMDVFFDSVEDAARRHRDYASDARAGILLTGDIDTMRRFAEQVGGLKRENVGGIHHRTGRRQKMRYVFLDPAEEQALRAFAARGVEITAQDVPAAQPVPLADLLNGRGDTL